MMNHWGLYWKVKQKHIPRTICSKLLQIDSFNLFKTNELAGFRIEPLKINAKRIEDHLIITYRKNKKHAYSISIDKRPCNYGGYRCYFKCPLCQTRMRILYLEENSMFLCRKCLNLAYQSQQMRPTKRYEYMSDKIKKFIENKGQFFSK